MNSEITFTPLCVFGSNRKYGQMENHLHVDCITHFSRKTKAAFILHSNEFQDSQRERERERERAHAHTNQLHSSHTHTNQLPQSDAKLWLPSQAKASLDCAAISVHTTLHHRDRTKIASTCSHPLNLTAMLHRCMSLIHHCHHHCHHHPRHHPSYPPS